MAGLAAAVEQHHGRAAGIAGDVGREPVAVPADEFDHARPPGVVQDTSEQRPNLPPADCSSVGSSPPSSIPVPDHDFDVTEVAVPWRLLTRAGHVVRFATERGAAPAADQRLIDGVIFGQLGAGAGALDFYREMQSEDAFRSPLAWGDIRPDEFDGLVLPGGHAPRMRQYLGSDVLRAKVAEYWALERPVGAICHGVLVLARTVDPTTGRSLLYGRRTTCLPKYMERSAFLATAWRLGRYYRTYPEYVEDEVRAALRDPADFVRGPRVCRRARTRDRRQPPRSASRTATTSRRGGPATPTCSRSGSPPGSRVDDRGNPPRSVVVQSG